MLNLTELVRGGTMCLGKAGLAEGTNANTYKILPPNSGVNVQYAINGIIYAIAPTDNIAMTAAAVQADLTTCLYLVCGNTSSATVTVKGTAVLTADLAAGTAVLQWPEPAANTCPIGAIRVQNDAGTFTAGSTDLGAGTVTDTYYDFLAIPPAPLTA